MVQVYHFETLVMFMNYEKLRHLTNQSNILHTNIIYANLWIKIILEVQINMVGHLFQNYDTIYVRFFPMYTCVLSCFVGFLFPSIWPFSQKRAYICAQKSPYICVTNKHVVYEVTESCRVRGTQLYRQQKTPSCTMALKSNFSLQCRLESFCNTDDIYELQLYPGKQVSHIQKYIFPLGRVGGTAMYAIQVHVSTTVNGMVFKQLTLGQGI